MFHRANQGTEYHETTRAFCKLWVRCFWSDITCDDQLGWDEEVPNDRPNHWICELEKCLSQPRCFDFHFTARRLWVFGFSDTSKQAESAVVYILAEDTWKCLVVKPTSIELENRNKGEDKGTLNTMNVIGCGEITAQKFAWKPYVSETFPGKPHDWAVLWWSHIKTVFLWIQRKGAWFVTTFGWR